MSGEKNGARFGSTVNPNTDYTAGAGSAKGNDYQAHTLSVEPVEGFHNSCVGCGTAVGDHDCYAETCTWDDAPDYPVTLTN